MGMANLSKIESSCLSWSGKGAARDLVRSELCGVLWVGGESRRGSTWSEAAEMCLRFTTGGGGPE